MAFSNIQFYNDKSLNPLFAQRILGLEENERLLMAGDFSSTKDISTLLPIYINCVKTRFNDKIYSVTHGIIFFQTTVKQGNLVNEEDAKKMYDMNNELIEEFWKNLDNIQKLNTLNNALKRFVLMGTPFTEEEKTRAAKRLLHLMKESEYDFNDQGTILVNCVKTLRNLGLKDSNIWKELFDFVSENSRKILHINLMDCFSVLLQVPEPIPTEALENTLAQIRSRIEFCTFIEIGNLLDSLIIFINNQREKKNLETYKQFFGKIEKMFKDIAEQEIEKQRIFRIHEYASFLFCANKLNEIKDRFGTPFNIPEILEVLDKYWKSVPDKTTNMQPAPIADIKKLFEFLKVFNRYVDPKYFPKELKKVFIQSVIVTYDVFHKDVTIFEELDGLIRILDANKELIEGEKIDCTISNPAYQKFLEIAHGDYRKLSVLAYNRE